MPEVDVIIPVWHQSAQWLRDALDSVRAVKQARPLLAWGYDNGTVLVCEDVTKQLQKYEDRLPTKERSYENLYTQIGCALEHAEAPYVMLFGADDVMYDGMIENLLAVVDDAAIAYCNYEMMDEQGKHLCYVDLKPYNFAFNCANPHYPDVCLLKREPVIGCGGWEVEKGRYACWWLWLKLGRHYAERVVHLPYYGFRYRQHDHGLHLLEDWAKRQSFISEVEAWAGGAVEVKA